MRLSRLGQASLVALAATGHIIYPILLGLVTRRRADPEPPGQAGWPTLTVVVPAYREAAVIEAKVADLASQDYPGEVHVLVVADDPGTARAARRAGVEVVSSECRTGKADALNRGFRHASSEVVVITDANTRLAPGSLRALSRWFADPSVRAVAGSKTVTGGSAEGLYWRFESWLKRREARTGSTIGLVGELAAVRGDAFDPLPADLAVEDLWMALDVLEAGGRIVYEPAAVAMEDPSPGWRSDWERRTRVVAGTLDVLWRRRRLLSPARGFLAAQLWGHRAVRSSLGPLAHLVLLLQAVRANRRSPWAALTVAAHGCGAIGVVRSARGARQSTIERAAAQALFLQAVGLVGLVRYLRGDRTALWPKPERLSVNGDRGPGAE